MATDGGLVGHGHYFNPLGQVVDEDEQVAVSFLGGLERTYDVHGNQLEGVLDLNRLQEAHLPSSRRLSDLASEATRDVLTNVFGHGWPPVVLLHLLESLDHSKVSSREHVIVESG